MKACDKVTLSGGHGCTRAELLDDAPSATRWRVELVLMIRVRRPQSLQIVAAAHSKGSFQRTFLRQGPQLQQSEQPSPQPPRQGGHTQQPDACACRTSSPCRLRRHIPLQRTAQPGFSTSLLDAKAKARRRNSRPSASNGPSWIGEDRFESKR